MKKHILGLALVVTMISSITMGCGSTKSASSSDSTSMKDSEKMKAPLDTAGNNGIDTAKKDTTKKPM